MFKLDPPVQASPIEPLGMLPPTQGAMVSAAGAGSGETGEVSNKTRVLAPGVLGGSAKPAGVLREEFVVKEVVKLFL